MLAGNVIRCTDDAFDRRELAGAIRPAPHMWPVSVLAAHIISTRVFWFHTIMREGPAALGAWLGLDDVDESARTPDGLLSGLAESWELIDGALARHTPANLDDL